MNIIYYFDKLYKTQEKRSVTNNTTSNNSNQTIILDEQKLIDKKSLPTLQNIFDTILEDKQLNSKLETLTPNELNDFMQELVYTDARMIDNPTNVSKRIRTMSKLPFEQINIPTEIPIERYTNITDILELKIKQFDKQENINKSLETHEKLIEIYHRQPNRKNKPLLLRKIAYKHDMIATKYQKQNNFNKAQIHYNEALKIFETLETCDEINKIELIQNKAYINSRLGKLYSETHTENAESKSLLQLITIEHKKRAISLFEQLENTNDKNLNKEQILERIIADNYALTKLYELQNDKKNTKIHYIDEIKGFKRLEKLTGKLNNIQGIIAAKEKLSTIYKKEKNYNAHIKELEDIIKYSTTEYDDTKNMIWTHKIANTYHTIGHAYKYKKDYYNAIKYLTKTEQLIKTFDPQLEDSTIQHQHASILGYISDTYKNDRSYLEAKPYSEKQIIKLNQLETKIDETNRLHELLEAHSRLATILKKLPEDTNQQYIDEFKKAKEIGEKLLCNTPNIEQLILEDTKYQLAHNTYKYVCRQILKAPTYIDYTPTNTQNQQYTQPKIPQVAEITI